MLYYKYNTLELINVNFCFDYPKFEKNVIFCDKEYEGSLNGYYNIIKDNNNFKMYYRAGDHNVWYTENNIKRNYASELLKKHQYLCVAESTDGLNFYKPNLELYEYKGNKKNNILFKNYFCHNFCVNYFETNNKYVGITGSKFDVNGLFLFESTDGYNWENKNKIISEDKLIPKWSHSNHFDSLNYIMYIPKTNKYHLYIRHNDANYPNRKVQVSISNDLNNFGKCELVNINNNDKEIYATGFELYPNNSNYYIGLITLHDQLTFNKYCSLVISIDSLNWELIIDNIFKDIQINHFLVKGFLYLDKFYLYCLENFDYENNKIKCYSFKKDRIGYLFSEEIGSFQTKILILKNTDIYINYETELEGYIKIELYDSNNNLILDSNNMSGNYEFSKIIWNKNIQLNKGNFYLKFTLNKSKIFSFYY